MENTTILILVVIIVLASLLPEILEVVGHVAEALGLGQVDEDPCGALAAPVPADAAVAEALRLFDGRLQELGEELPHSPGRREHGAEILEDAGLL